MRAFQLYCPKSLGEPGRNRTCDPLIKSQLLYRLSYRLPQERRNLVFDLLAVNGGFRGFRSCLPAFVNDRILASESRSRRGRIS
ncbi:MAG: hypothetical protein RIR41_3596 [Pseudomonadota bacterium]